MTKTIIMTGMIGMIKIVLALFTTATLFSLYSSYSGLGLEEITQKKAKSHSSRMGSSHSYSNGGWSYGK